MTIVSFYITQGLFVKCVRSDLFADLRESLISANFVCCERKVPSGFGGKIFREVLNKVNVTLRQDARVFAAKVSFIYSNSLVIICQSVLFGT